MQRHQSTNRLKKYIKQLFPLIWFTYLLAFLSTNKVYNLWAESCGCGKHCSIHCILVMHSKSLSLNLITMHAVFFLFFFFLIRIITCHNDDFMQLFSPLCSLRCLTMWWAPWGVWEGCQSFWCQGDASVWRCIAEQHLNSQRQRAV